MLSHCFQVLCLQQGNCRQSCSGFCTPTVWKAKHRWTMNMFNQIDDNRCHWYGLFSVGAVCLCNSWDNCAVMMVLDLLLLVLPGSNHLKPQLLQTMTLITQHKPIERSTDMAFMTKQSQIQTWLNGLYTENRYGQRMTSKHVHQGGVPASRHPWW